MENYNTVYSRCQNKLCVVVFCTFCLGKINWNGAKQLGDDEKTKLAKRWKERNVLISLAS